MILVKNLLQIRFTVGTRPWLELRDLLRVATTDESAEMQANPIVIDRADTKTRVTLSIRAVVIERQTDASLAEGIQEMRTLVRNFHRASSFPPIEMMRYDVEAIEPFALPFHDLVALMKAHFLTPTRIADAASDMALVFDLREEGVLKNVHIGPMDKAQLTKDILRWPMEDIPDTFWYLLAGYEATGEREFSEDVLDSFLSEATSWQAEELQSLAQELKENTE